jgi:2-polyprenyl-3-methyl-5-hydroxy-6-metoxy-1,4-benzoquinol methylase
MRITDRLREKAIRTVTKWRLRLTWETELIPCVLCGNQQDFTSYTVDDHFRLPTRYATCNRCGLCQQRPMPTKRFIDRLYSTSMYRGLYLGRFRATKNANAEEERKAREHAAYIDTLSLSEAPRILDFGSATGDFLVKLKEHRPHARIVGIEPGTNFNHLYAQRLDGLYGSLEELPAEERFELITSWHVLEHLRDPVAALAILREHLVPGGLLAIEVPNLVRLGRNSRGFHVGHLYYFTPETMTLALIKAGFEVIEVQDHHVVDSRFGMGVLARTK